MKCLIRCDSSNIIGTGHVIRCLNLCEYYQIFEFTFICRNFKLNISDKIISANHKLILLDYNIEPQLDNYDTWIGKSYLEEQNEIIDILKTNKYDIFIIDHYGIDYILEAHAKQFCPKIIVITDLYNKSHSCDVLLNYNTFETNENIIKINKLLKSNITTGTAPNTTIIPTTAIKLGINNLIINKKFFINDNTKKNYKEQIKNIVLNMGGADPNNYIMKILYSLQNWITNNKIIVNIIVGYSNNNLDFINKYITLENSSLEKSLYFIHHNINFDELIKLHIYSDIAIGSLSITAFERLLLKVPQITIKIADNQNIDEYPIFNTSKIDNILNQLQLENYKNNISSLKHFWANNDNYDNYDKNIILHNVKKLLYL